MHTMPSRSIQRTSSKLVEGHRYSKHQLFQHPSVNHSPESCWHSSILQPERVLCPGLCVRMLSGLQPFPGHVCPAIRRAKFTTGAQGDQNPANEVKQNMSFWIKAKTKLQDVI